MKRRKCLRTLNRQDKLNVLYVQLPAVQYDGEIAYMNGEWVEVIYDSIDIGIGFQQFISGGAPLHKSYKAAYRMLHSAVRKEKKHRV